MDKNKSNKIISIPLFIPLSITVIFISLIIKICNLNSTVLANSKEEKLENRKTVEEVRQEEICTITEIEENEEVLEETEENIEEKTEVHNTTQNTQTTSRNSSILQTEDYTVIGILDIPSLGIKYTILSETSDKLLKISLTKYWGANPNEVGNMVVLGHNYNDNKFFSKLPNIKKGEIVKITDSSGTTLDYTVYDTYVIDPYDNSCTSQLTDGHTEITLITCYNYGRTRFVVKARAN